MHTIARTLLDRRRVASFLAITLLLLTVGFLRTSVAHADETGGYPYAGISGPGTNAAESYWTDSSGNPQSPYGYYYRNCTDYVAWKLQSLGVADAKTRGLGHGGVWAVNAEGRAGVTVNTTPAYGAAAVSTAGTFGHVAFVEAVHSNGTITVSEYNWQLGNGTFDGNYHQQTGTPASMGLTKFVHFGLNPGPGGGPETPNRVALLTPNSNVYAKDGLGGGGWMDQGTQAPYIAVGGARQALLNSAGQVYAKDDLGAANWLDQGATAKKVVVGFAGRMFIITPDNWLYAKDGLGAGGWINQDTQVLDVAVGHDRVAIVNPCGAVYAKDNMGSGGWIQQSDCGVAKDVEVSAWGRVAILTPDGHVFAKDSIASSGGWLDQNAVANQLVLGGNRLMILTPDSHVYAKDHLGAGGWVDQGTTAVEIAITKRGRLVLRNSADQVYAKDDTNPGGWIDQGAVAIKIAA